MTRWHFLLAAFVAGPAFSGCGTKNSHSRDERTDKVELYQKGKGVRLDEGTRQLFGVELVEVAERTFARTLTNAAHVYEASGETARATMPLNDDATNAIVVGKVSVTFDNRSVTGAVAGIKRDRASSEAIVEFPRGGNALAIGASVNVIIQSEPKPVTVVPRDAVLSAADGDYVYVVNGRHLTRTKVKAGGEFEGLVEIVDGLYAGDSVAARAVNSLWFVELSALKGGKPCCVAPRKN